MVVGAPVRVSAMPATVGARTPLLQAGLRVLIAGGPAFPVAEPRAASYPATASTVPPAVFWTSAKSFSRFIGTGQRSDDEDDQQGNQRGQCPRHGQDRIEFIVADERHFDAAHRATPHLRETFRVPLPTQEISVKFSERK